MMNRSTTFPMTPAFDEQKTTEAAGIILRESGGEIGPLRLLKLLYLADRKAWKKWERPINSDVYFSLPEGPILSITFNIIKDEASGRGAFWKRFIRRANRTTLHLEEMPPIQRLSPAEIDLLKETVAEHRDKDDWALRDFTHALPEYEEPGKSRRPIPLSRLLKELDFAESDISRIGAELLAEAQLDAVLG